MPTPIPSEEKNAFIALVEVAPRPGGAYEAVRLQTLLNNFEDIPLAIGRQLGLFASNNAYLTECMKVFADNDADLMSVGIYVGKTLTDVSNPALLINSTYSGTVTIDDEIKGLGLLNSMATNLVISGKTLPYLYIASSTIDLLTASSEGSAITYLTMPFFKVPAVINAVADGSRIDNAMIDPRNIFGGFQTVDPTIECAKPVTELIASAETHNSITLSWILPDGGYLFINVFYRVIGTLPWLAANNSIGSYTGEAGYIFSQLDPDTQYDFKVEVTCNNGGVSTTVVSSKTTCC